MKEQRIRRRGNKSAVLAIIRYHRYTVTLNAKLRDIKKICDAQQISAICKLIRTEAVVLVLLAFDSNLE